MLLGNIAARRVDRVGQEHGVCGVFEFEPRPRPGGEEVGKEIDELRHPLVVTDQLCVGGLLCQFLVGNGFACASRVSFAKGEGVSSALEDGNAVLHRLVVGEKRRHGRLGKDVLRLLAALMQRVRNDGRHARLHAGAVGQLHFLLFPVAVGKREEMRQQRRPHVDLRDDFILGHSADKEAAEAKHFGAENKVEED